MMMVSQRTNGNTACLKLKLAGRSIDLSRGNPRGCGRFVFPRRGRKSIMSDLTSPLSTGEIVARNYQILGRAGAGGMGVVYRARDLKLERFVALKFLPLELNASEKDKQRILKEARIASSLDHPNIGAIHGIDETPDGRIFIIMAFYEGRTLAERIHLHGDIPLPEVIDIATQIARGLAEAHSHNIVHRDVKPSNVMLTGSGVVKIVDFGLAHVTETTATLTHGTVGTASYMSPEQTMGKPIDQRSDIWALGVVLSEMLTRKNLFKRDTLSATILAVLNEPPGSLEGVPIEIQQIVYRALSKDPDTRYQNCAEVLRDLEQARATIVIPDATDETLTLNKSKVTSEFRRYVAEASKSAWLPAARPRHSYAGIIAGIVVLGLVAIAGATFAFYPPARRLLAGKSQTVTGTGTASAFLQAPVLAVLPFKPIAGDEKLTALGQGVVESVAAKLARLSENRALEVIPARNLQERGVTSLADARKQFGANLGLAVTLEQSGELIRVSYSLLNAQNGTVLGGDSVTVPAADAFSVEDDVAAGAVKALQLRLLPEEQTALKIHGTSNPSAYNYYLQARGYLLNFTATGNVENAILMLKEALKADPNFGGAKAALGEAYWRKYWLTKDKHWTTLAKQECDNAVTLGNAGAEGHRCLGLVADGTGQYRDAVTEYQQALALEPGNEDAYVGLALAYEHQGAITEAEQTYQRAIEAHPNSPYSYNSLGTFYLRRDQYDKAVQMFQKVIALAPEGYGAYVNLGDAYNYMGRYSESIEALRKSISIRPSYAGYVNLGVAYGGLNRFGDEAAAYEEAIKLNPREYVTWGNLAEARYYAGLKNEALTAYRKAVELASEELKVNPHDSDVLSNLANYYSVLGQRDDALFYLQQALQYGHNDKEVLVDAASVYNHLGESGVAVEWLGKAIQAGYPASKIVGIPEFRNLDNNPGYKQLTEKVQSR
jgi:serine/threonine protein kinase/tetratricopeptide (TPR) repeat protein